MSKGVLGAVVLLWVGACQRPQPEPEPVEGEGSAAHTASDSADIVQMLDRWHALAAEGDSAYFDHFAPNAVFIGTDVSERWGLAEFRVWSRPFFQRGEAWSFAPRERRVVFSDRGNIAWFDEVLDTWMGPCRATGVVLKQGDAWRIAHYQLSVTVPNDSIHTFRRSIWGLGE
ncbi:DUF4440 domain-containing protein [bacterium]|nr:DUF4440 domain-containing protein [bacterium]